MPLRIVCAVILAALLAGCTMPTMSLDPGKDALAYRTDVVSAFSDLSHALTGVAAAAQASNVSGRQWQEDLLADLAIIRTARMKLDNITAPPALAENHAKLEKALDLCVSGADQLEPTVRTGVVDMAGLYKSAALFQQCALDMSPVISDISAYVAQFDK